MEEGNIKAIDRTSVHKICSGQVVLTLATAIKELVENSIDAGATIIEVKLEEHGSKLIEVIDNGRGVKSTDFQSLTLKHHTSKIADFADLPFVSTFGFRGEALSSLCALCNLEIATRHTDSEVGTHLKFDHNGIIVKSSPTARQVGTTVVLKDLFSTLPVRHKEFLRHVRREFAKMIQVLTAYCLISVNKRITCIHTSDKGRKSTVLSTHSSQNLKDNIISIFGDKQVKQLMEIKQSQPTDEILKEYFLPESSAEKSKIFNLEGYISNSTHGEGRSSTDRQFYFITGRPCDLPKVSKLINEIYHQFNKNQYPFVLLNISLNEGYADVNVTPDKRQVFIPEEKVLLALIKSTLIELYGSQPSQIMMSPLSFAPVKKHTENQSSESSSGYSSPVSSQTEQNASTLKRKFTIPILDDEDDEEPIPSTFKSQKLYSNLNAELDSKSVSEPSLQQNIAQDSISPSNCGFKSSDVLSDAGKLKPQTPEKSKMANGIVNFTLTLPFNEDKVFKKSSPRKTGHDRLKAILNAARRHSGSANDSDFKSQKICRSAKSNESISGYLEKGYVFTPISESSETKADVLEENAENKTDDIGGTADMNDENDLTFDEPSLRKKRYKNISFSMDMFSSATELESSEELNQQTCNYRKFRSKILPTDNQSAEDELKKEIGKENFFEMEIIGQFNLGFIVTRLYDDLFIIDQHATDEKYNFEQLQKTTVLETQQLFQPQPLNLTAVSEAILLDNLNVFEMNGFKFQINEENSTGEKVQLVSVPVSQNWRFGKEDVDELIFMLTDNPIRMVRPSRVNQMFASRACRKSVMIGTALTTSMMKNLVHHMGEIDQPWNCPHGRPTMRHLFNLNLLNPS